VSQDLELVRPRDTFFLHAESAAVPQHVGGLAIVGSHQRPAGSIGIAELRTRVEASLWALPRLRQRLAGGGPWLRPAWVDDARFALARHVNETVLPGPGRTEQLVTAVEHIMEERLDRSGPLWQFELISGLETGEQALLLKLHHAVADGLGTLHVASQLFDGGATTPANKAEPWQPRSVPRALTARRLARQFEEPVRALGKHGRALASEPRATSRRASRAVRGLWELARAGPAPVAPINGGLSGRRRMALVELPAPAIRSAHKAWGATVNDVVLTAALQGVADTGLNGGAAQLRVMIPLAGRRPGAQLSPGTWTTTLSADLPVGAMDPVERLAAVLGVLRRLRGSNQPHGARLVLDLVGTGFPPFLHSLFVHFAYRGKWFNTIVSNLPGSKRLPSMLGAPVSLAYPLMPLADDLGLTLASVSWGGAVTLGITTDPALVPDVDALAAAMVGCTEVVGKQAKEEPERGP